MVDVLVSSRQGSVKVVPQVFFVYLQVAMEDSSFSEQSSFDTSECLGEGCTHFGMSQYFVFQIHGTWRAH